jgi:hypothetical protein
VKATQGLATIQEQQSISDVKKQGPGRHGFQYSDHDYEPVVLPRDWSMASPELSRF